MIDWKVVDNVFLDMDGTLLDLHFDNYFWLEHLPQRVSEIKGGTVDNIRADLNARYKAMKGTLDWYCLDYWQRELSIDMVGLKHEITDKIRFRPSAYKFLLWLQNSGKRIFLVSNAHRSSINLKFEYLGMSALFDHVCSSHDYQSPKEQQTFWRSFCEDIPFSCERTLFIDDNVEVLDSAQKFGIRHLLSIEQPDLSQPILSSCKYRQISNFDDLMLEAADTTNVETINV